MQSPKVHIIHPSGSHLFPSCYIKVSWGEHVEFLVCEILYPPCVMSHPAYQGLRDIQVTQYWSQPPSTLGSWGQKIARLFYSWENMKLRSKAACNLLAAFPLCCQEQACHLRHKEGAICRTVEAWESWESYFREGVGWCCQPGETLSASTSREHEHFQPLFHSPLSLPPPLPQYKGTNEIPKSRRLLPSYF